MLSMPVLNSVRICFTVRKRMNLRNEFESSVIVVQQSHYSEVEGKGDLAMVNARGSDLGWMPSVFEFHVSWCKSGLLSIAGCCRIVFDHGHSGWCHLYDQR